jgi:hypothetical protein
MGQIRLGILGFAVVSACLATATSTELASPYRPYRLHLTSFVIPPGPPIGVLLKARIDGGPQLRLLLDSGAQSIVLDKRAAARSGYSAGFEVDLVGAGSAAKTARVTYTATVTIEDLVLRHCRTVIVESKLLEGIDGVIPLSLFSGFRIRLDLPGSALDLQPYAPVQAGQEEGFLPARNEDELLFLPATLNDAHDGFVLLDTGSSFNAISHDTARVLKVRQVLSSPVSLLGGVGAIEGYLVPSGVRFRMGTRAVAVDQVVAVDLAGMAGRHRFEVAGLMGFPALRRSVLTINYRDGLVRFDAR